MGQQESDGLLTIRNAWMEGKAPMPSDPVSVFETNINNLLALFLGKGTSILLGHERSASQPVTIINKLSGKALEVMNSSIGPGACIQRLRAMANLTSGGLSSVRNLVNTWPFRR